MFVLDISQKFIVTLIILLVYVKVSGKSQLAPMSELDQVGNMVIGALVGGALLNSNITMLQAAAAVAIWVVLLLTIRYLKSHSTKMRDMIDGKATRLVQNGKILSGNFLKINLPIRDFETIIHQKGINNLSELYNVWFELNGDLTIVKKGEEPISMLLIEGGKVNHDHLERIEKDEQWLTEEIKNKGFKDIDEVFCAEWYSNDVWFYPYVNEVDEKAQKP